MSETNGITLGEVVRIIERNHAETRDDIASLRQETRDEIQALHTRLDRDLAATNGRVDQAVPVNVYEADKRGTDIRFKNIEDNVAGMRATTKWAVGLALTALLALVGALIPLLAK